jgi:AsmA family/AsmA-like C-terminal region
MPGEAKSSSPRRWILLAVATLALLAFVLPPLVNISRYRHRIADNISRSIGRQVRISAVKFHLLPLPGFEFSDFSVQEDPQFGAEPILHSSSVVADLRLSSLWRGKLEVSRIHFDDASLNLVRNSNGLWNVASVLVQVAQIPHAPTGQRHAGSAPRFPYIEAENTRINFKIGNEKKPLSFLNSDLSISLGAGDDWELHFRAQPVRTDLDLYLSDTGVLRVDGTLGRAAVLDQMPLKLNMDWSGVPLGQLSRLTLGEDIGWRGGLSVQAEVDGTAERAQVTSTLKVAGFHRAEFTAARPLDVATTCRATFRKQSSSLEDIDCSSPVGKGELRLTGAVQQVQTTPQAQLTLAMDHVPAAAVLSALQQLRSGLGTGVQAAGALDGHFEYAAQSGRRPVIAGEVALDSLSLTPPDAEKPFVLAPVHLRCESPENGIPALLLQPVRVAMGAPTPVTVDGRFTGAGFDLHVNGGMSLARLQPFSKSFPWLGAHPASTVALVGPGSAAVDLNLRGKWLLPELDTEHPDASMTVEGNIAIRNGELTTSYLSQPLKIQTAQAVLSSTQIAWTNAAVSYGPLQAQATLEYPALCVSSVPCVGHFSAVLPVLDVGALQSALLGSSQGGQFLRQLLARIDRSSVQWPNLSGSFKAGQLSLGKLVLHDASGTVDIGENAIRIRSVNGHVANGTMHLAGSVDATGDSPSYQLDVQVTNAVPSAFASIFEEKWGGGVANFSSQLHMSGFDAQDLRRSVTGTLHWDWTKGGLDAEEPVPPEAQILGHFDQWSADAAIADSTIKITRSLLASGSDAIPVSGTISFDRELDMKGASPVHPFTVTGTLDHPQVKAIAEEAAN